MTIEDLKKLVDRAEAVRRSDLAEAILRVISLLESPGASDMVDPDIVIRGTYSRFSREVRNAEDLEDLRLQAPQRRA